MRIEFGSAFVKTTYPHVTIVVTIKFGSILASWTIDITMSPLHPVVWRNVRKMLRTSLELTTPELAMMHITTPFDP